MKNKRQVVLKISVCCLTVSLAVATVCIVMLAGAVKQNINHSFEDTLVKLEEIGTLMGKSDLDEADIRAVSTCYAEVCSNMICLDSYYKTFFGKRYGNFDHRGCALLKLYSDFQQYATQEMPNVICNDDTTHQIKITLLTDVAQISLEILNDFQSKSGEFSIGKLGTCYDDICDAVEDHLQEFYGKGIILDYRDSIFDFIG